MILFAKKLAAALPEWLWYALALVFFTVVVFSLGQCSGVNQEKAAQAVVERKALENARDADEAARGQVKEDLDDVRDSNQKARDAARSDDPLGDGLRSLRASQTGPNPPAR